MKRVVFSFFYLLSFYCFTQSSEILKADLLFSKAYYGESITIYSSYLESHIDDAEVHLKLAQCYLKLFDEESAEAPLWKAFELSDKVSNEMYFTRGTYYHLKNNFKKALKDFYQINIVGYPSLRKQISECELGKLYVKKPIDIELMNLGYQINSPENEVLPKITANNKTLYFSSYRQGAIGGMRYPMDIYSATNNEGQWGKVMQLGETINSEYNEACVGIAPDGLTMYLYKGSNGGDLFVSKFRAGEWQKPLEFPFNTKAKESSMSISPDGQQLLFVRKKKGQTSVMLTSKLLEDSTWSIPSVFELDTRYDEETPFFHADGKTLFFSSKGYGSMGGFDIMCARRMGEGWSTPENLGYPLNSAKDELGFVLTANGQTAYYSSYKADGSGKQDIYQIAFKKKLFSTNMILLSGVITNDKNDLLEATVKVIDIGDQSVITSVFSSSLTGEFILPLESGKEYGIRIEKTGYLFHSSHFSISSQSDYQENVYNVVLFAYDSGQPVILENVFFASGKSSLQPKSTIELLHLVKILNNNSKLKVLILGHTDDVGDEKDNVTLSLERAKSVRKFLILKGVESSRIEVKGYGSSLPIGDNSSEKGRKKNRRTEFVVRED